jgi:hypothetical protein
MIIKDLSTIIKRNDGKGLGTYWHIANIEKDKTSRINTKDVNDIERMLPKLAGAGFTDLEKGLPLTLWSNKTTLINQLKNVGISSKDAYIYIAANRRTNQLILEEDRLNRLIQFMCYQDPECSPTKLAETLFVKMAFDYKKAAIKGLEELEEANGRDEDGYIITNLFLENEVKEEQEEEKEPTEEPADEVPYNGVPILDKAYNSFRKANSSLDIDDYDMECAFEKSDEYRQAVISQALKEAGID